MTAHDVDRVLIVCDWTVDPREVAAAGLAVLANPRFGGYLVASWLGGIIVSLLLVGGYGDIALRDFGLLLSALTLARLASADFAQRAEARIR